MAKKILEGAGNAKTRTLIVFGIILLVVVVILIFFGSHKPNPLQDQESHSSKIPHITSVPGNVTSEKYQELFN